MEANFLEVNDNKARTVVWLRPSTLQRVDAWMEEDNCKTRSEFLEKALRFYIGYLESNNAADYLCEVLGALISGILTDNGNRIRSLLFKWCVELNMTCHTVAAHFRADEIDRRGLRAYAVREVMETNGQISFDNALDVQRDTPEDDL